MDERRAWMAHPLTRLVLAVLLLAALGVAAWAATRGDSAGNGKPTLAGAPTAEAIRTEEAAPGPLDSRAPIVGQPAPAFALRDLDGQLVRLDDFRGKVVWINFWATWCRPCKEELPRIQRLQDQYPDDLVVLAVDWQESGERARAFWSANGLSMRALLDRSGGVYEQYRLQGLPDSFFVARDGTLAALHYGYMTEETMRKRLAAAGLE